MIDGMLSGPIAHPDIKDSYRVPMRVDDGLYIIYVGDKFTRSFRRGMLPDEVKTKLAFINTMQKENTVSEVMRFQPTWLSVYVLPKDEALHDVGWRVVDDVYCLVLNQQTIDLLVGRTLNKELK